MSTLNKFIIYQCNVCKRQTEIMIDGSRPDPVRCNITYKCRGKLQRIGESSTKKFLFTPPIAGLQDYIPRGTEILPTTAIAKEEEISLFSGGGSGMITLALPRKVVNHFEVLDSQGLSFIVASSETEFNDVKVRLNLYKISPELLQFKRYSYLVPGTVQIVQGNDDSPNKNNLRFTPANTIRVFANGIELDPSKYDRSLDNQITFTPAIYESNNLIDIIVYNNYIDSENLELIQLEFLYLNHMIPEQAAFLSANCWGDTKSVEIENQERYLLFCHDLSLLTIDSSYGVLSLDITNNETLETKIVKPSEISLLLGINPFGKKDKELLAFVNGEDLMDGVALLIYKQNQKSGNFELIVNESRLTQLIRPIVPAVTIKLEPVEQVSVVKTSIKHQYILGPS